ncbi:hypothetical protein LEP1GSC124_3345 [Leptospira interrogans serovar Pyrogenes str. 200701872]|uniref:Uncharacterized protein n=1 Tax=Leptospira interrogans serovar Pyrogenes str. 200701872 TaxID=1193029 RepID=M6ZRM3_LEPIR|nr:hypothetical protein LEP1GSC124_3345 [Leptospira interrogans serovar Pyrogenes str. 200701872]
MKIKQTSFLILVLHFFSFVSIYSQAAVTNPEETKPFSTKEKPVPAEETFLKN